MSPPGPWPRHMVSCFRETEAGWGREEKALRKQLPEKELVTTLLYLARIKEISTHSSFLESVAGWGTREKITTTSSYSRVCNTVPGSHEINSK